MARLYFCAVVFVIFKLPGNKALLLTSFIHSVKNWLVNPDYLSILIGISPSEDLILGIFLIISSITLTETEWNFLFFHQVFTLNFENNWFVICFIKCSFFAGHPKVLNFSTFSAKFISKVLAISSLFILITFLFQRLHFFFLC